MGFNSGFKGLNCCFFTLRRCIRGFHVLLSFGQQQYSDAREIPSRQFIIITTRQKLKNYDILDNWDSSVSIVTRLQVVSLRNCYWMSSKDERFISPSFCLTGSRIHSISYSVVTAVTSVRLKRLCYGADRSPLTAIWCRGWEWVQLYWHCLIWLCGGKVATVPSAYVIFLDTQQVG